MDPVVDTTLRVGLALLFGFHGGLVADRDHQVHRWRIGKVVDPLCPMTGLFADIDTQFRHRFDRQGLHRARVRSRAEHLVTRSTTRPQEAFRHL